MGDVLDDNQVLLTHEEVARKLRLYIALYHDNNQRSFARELGIPFQKVCDALSPTRQGSFGTVILDKLGLKTVLERQKKARYLVVRR